MLTVTERDKGVCIRQDRFLSTGSAQPKDNEPIWTVPLSLLTVDDSGAVKIDKSAVLDEREKAISLDVSRPWKLNAGTVTFCTPPTHSARAGRRADFGQAEFSTRRTGWSRSARTLPRCPRRSRSRTGSGSSTTRSL